jgi:hypothetical protein
MASYGHLQKHHIMMRKSFIYLTTDQISAVELISWMFYQVCQLCLLPNTNT